LNSNINRALIFQRGGSLGAYEVGADKAINVDSNKYKNGDSVRCIILDNKRNNIGNPNDSELSTIFLVS
jgi:hypothetical protein